MVKVVRFAVGMKGRAWLGSKRDSVLRRLMWRVYVSIYEFVDADGTQGQAARDTLVDRG